MPDTSPPDTAPPNTDGAPSRPVWPPASPVGPSAHAVFRVGRRRGDRSWHRRTPALVLAAALVLTAAATAFVAVTGRARDQARFDNAVEAAQDRIGSRLETYVALLYGGAGLFAASTEVSAADFRHFVDRLDVTHRYPGLQGIGYSRVLAPPGEPVAPAALDARLRAGGGPAARLTPDAPRAEYHAIVYIEPRSPRNDAALGFDMHTEPTRRAAMDRARDLGRAAASGTVVLRQEIEGPKQQGFLVYVPVFRTGEVPLTVDGRRAALRGFVYAAFRGEDLLAGIFGSERQPRVAFRVFDGPDTTRGALLADSRTVPGTPHEDGAPLDRPTAFRSVRALDVAGRPWTIVYTPLAGSATGSGDVVALAIALFGALVSAALYFVTAAEVRAREAAERSDALRSRFFAAMSHEIRTPINAIIGYNDLLLAGVYGELPSAQRDGIARSQRAASHLLELVNDVLDLSKLEAGKMDVATEPVQLHALLDDLLTTIRPMADARGCPLVLDAESCMVTLHTDPRRLRQILLNLLSNATKFGGGRPVSVRCRLVPHGAPAPLTGRRRTAGDAVSIAVTDQGAGIAPEDRERIFEEFVQLPGTTPGGTGLGLPISRRLAELLGGTLTLRSEPGEGSTFCVTLPLRDRRR